MNRLKIGDFDCWPLSDGEFVYPGSTVLPPESIPPDELTVPYTAMLVNTGSARILIDTGAGALGPNTGKLPENLTAAGFTPAEIDIVVLSHAHPDHIAGVARFQNARLVIMRTEFDFWTAAETQSKLENGELYGLGSLEQLMARYVREHLSAVDDLSLLEQPTEIEPGVLVFPAPGHTPGHAAVLISSGRQQLLYLADAVLHPAQFANPDWTSAFDLSRDDGQHAKAVAGPCRHRSLPRCRLSPAGRSWRCGGATGAVPMGAGGKSERGRPARVRRA